MASRKSSPERLQVRIVGVVQGVGFRPFVYRLAHELKLAGWVLNDENGVTIEAEGPSSSLLLFLERLQKEKPAASLIFALDHRFIESLGESEFEIHHSEAGGKPQTWILPDLATCDECKLDIRDESNRRHGYAFTNCTNCGPRFSIIDGLPYDRPMTSMAEFVMCADCRSEYEDPKDRRFHAQPNACARCGPQLSYWTPSAGTSAEGTAALERAVEAIRDGQVLAVKGLGGFHIVVDAANEKAVADLRQRKRRPYKAFAVMYPRLESLRAHVEVPTFAEGFLESMQAPILILSRTQRGFTEIAASVAPDSPSLGVFLPYTPLHALLLDRLDRPVVATSGNLTDQPTLHRDDDAKQGLSRLCDGWLLHDRPIRRQADDSVLHVVTRPIPKPQSLRRARGYTPLPILAPRELPPILALGGHKNAVFALCRGREIILSQHLGDLSSYEGQSSFRSNLDDFRRLYGIEPEFVAHDLHPDYFTTSLASELSLPRLGVQHHHAHLAACVLENQVEGSVLGLTWDGTGYGPDQTVWGGEFLRGDAGGFDRVASLVPFRLPGGEKAIEQTWRIAVALLFECFGEDLPKELPLFAQAPPGDVDVVIQMLQKDVRSPVTTSMGRLFDGVSAILGLCFENTHQAQAPQLLEYAAWRGEEQADTLEIPIVEDAMLRLDWRPLIREMVSRLEAGAPVDTLAAGFHEAVATGAMDIIEKLGEQRVALAGGVFCNRYLTETILMRLESTGRRGYIHSQLPPTDGSLAAGQMWVAAHAIQQS